MGQRTWTAREREILRTEYPQCARRELTIRELARRLGRTRGAVYQAARALGLTATNKPLTPADEATFRGLYDAGRTDAEIERATGFDRHRVAGWRRGEGLPVNAEGMRRKGVRGVVAQARALGLKSVGGGLRRYGFAKFARRYGLPENLNPREVQIVLHLARGPATKAEIAAALGVKYTPGRSRSSLKSARNGSYLGDLANRGLITSVRRKHGSHRGQWHSVYSLTPYAIALLTNGGAA